MRSIAFNWENFETSGVFFTYAPTHTPATCLHAENPIKEQNIFSFITFSIEFFFLFFFQIRQTNKTNEGNRTKKKVSFIRV